MKKCKKCGAPLEGFLYNTIGKLIGLKPSAKDPELCNKCEQEPEAKAPVNTDASEPVAPVMKEETTESKEAKEKDDFHI